MILNNGVWFGDIEVFPSERPDGRPRQVMDVVEVMVGQTYIKHTKMGAFQIKIVSEVYQKPDDQWWVDVQWGDLTTDLSLSDMGVTAYAAGTWNPTNWLEFIGD